MNCKLNVGIKVMFKFFEKFIVFAYSFFIIIFYVLLSKKYLKIENFNLNDVFNIYFIFELFFIYCCKLERWIEKINKLQKILKVLTNKIE